MNDTLQVHVTQGPSSKIELHDDDYDDCLVLLCYNNICHLFTLVIWSVLWYINVNWLDATGDWLPSRSRRWKSTRGQLTSLPQISYRACLHADQAAELRDAQIRRCERMESLVRRPHITALAARVARLYSTLGAPLNQAELRAATNLTDG